MRSVGDTFPQDRWPRRFAGSTAGVLAKSLMDIDAPIRLRVSVLLVLAVDSRVEKTSHGHCRWKDSCNWHDEREQFPPGLGCHPALCVLYQPVTVASSSVLHRVYCFHWH